MVSWDRGPFLLSAAPGAGKTRPELAREGLRRGAIRSVLVACPTAPLTRQWARAAARLGLQLAPDARTARPPRDFSGVVVTYARLAKAPATWARGAGPDTLVIADEAHHLGEELAWGESFAAAFGGCARWLLLSGTPFRSDATPIPGVRYDADGLAEPDFSYSYADAVRDGICRPVCFVAYDGTLSWQSGEDVIESSFETVLSKREAGRRYRTAISTELPDGLPRILREADNKLRELRRDGHGDAGGLCIAADSDHARQIAALLRGVTGRAPVVVLHQEPRAAIKLAAFTDSREPWIVAVNMVSEGVDIPRLRVGVYATAAKTPLVFRQIVGRFVRILPRRPLDPSWLYLPADPVLRGHAASVEEELRHALRPPADASGEPELERSERRATEPTAQPAFVPLSADVAAQMTLFGPPGGGTATGGQTARLLTPAPAPIAPAPALNAPAPAPIAPAPAPTPAAFERRAQLRSERHRLVSELTRRDGATHQEVNAWLNRKVKVASVQEATLEQLERSVELLVGRLTTKR
jgi:superfamily II DNA or RNA helicase